MVVSLETGVKKFPVLMARILPCLTKKNLLLLLVPKSDKYFSSLLNQDGAFGLTLNKTVCSEAGLDASRIQSFFLLRFVV